MGILYIEGLTNQQKLFFSSLSTILHNQTKLTHFWPMLLFYTPWKHQKTFGFLVFSGGINGNIGQTWEKKHSHLQNSISLEILENS